MTTYLDWKRWASIATGCAVLAAQPSVAAGLVPAVSSASVEFGASEKKTKLVRFGVQSNWDKRWLQSNGTHLGGYWDLTLSKWYSDGNAGGTQNVTDIGITPVFRFQRDNKKGGYLEGGIGLHRLSDIYYNGNIKLSTRFQFGDHLGVGYVFDNMGELAVKIQHFSNGGYKKPNGGINFLVLKASYPF